MYVYVSRKDVSLTDFQKEAWIQSFITLCVLGCMGRNRTCKSVKDTRSGSAKD